MASGGLGRDQKCLILHQPGRRRGEETRDLLARVKDKVGDGCAGGGGELGVGRNQNALFSDFAGVAIVPP